MLIHCMQIIAINSRKYIGIINVLVHERWLAINLLYFPIYFPLFLLLFFQLYVILEIV